MVDVAHHRDDRGARQGFGLVGRLGVGQEGFRIIQLGGDGGMAEFLDHDHGRFLVQDLVDGDHLAQLHQVLDDLGRLHGHLVGQVGDGNRFRHVNFTRDEFRLHRFLVVSLAAALAARALAAPAASLAARAPGVAPGARRQGFSLGRLLAAVVGPARGHIGGLDDLLALGFLLDGRLGASGLVQCAGGGRFLGFGSAQDLARLPHHFAQRGGLGFGGATGTFAVGIGRSATGLARRGLRGGNGRGGRGRGFGAWRRFGGLNRLGRGGRLGHGFGDRGFAHGVLIGTGFGRGGGLGGFLLRVGFVRCGLGHRSLGLDRCRLGRSGVGARGLGADLGGRLGRGHRRLGRFGLGRGRLRGRRSGHGGLGTGGLDQFGAVTLDQHALFADFDLDRARTPGTVGLVDFRRLAARQHDLLAHVGAVRTPQGFEQGALVCFGHVGVHRIQLDAGRAEMIQQDVGGHVQFFGELGDGVTRHSTLSLTTLKGGAIRCDEAVRLRRPRTSGPAPA